MKITLTDYYTNEIIASRQIVLTDFGYAYKANPRKYFDQFEQALYALNNNTPDGVLYDDERATMRFTNKAKPTDLEQYIAAIKREILHNHVLSDCKTFAELHNYCDANMLGDEYLPKFATLGEMIDFANDAMYVVDAWIKSRAKFTRFIIQFDRRGKYGIRVATSTGTALAYFCHMNDAQAFCENITRLEQLA